MKRMAYVQRNFRLLSFEQKTIFLLNAATLLFCFFPWFQLEDQTFSSGEYSGLEGIGYSAGFAIFVLSFVIVAVFVDTIFEKKKIPLPINRWKLFLGMSIFCLIGLYFSSSATSAHAVLSGQEFTVRFGFYLATMAQLFSAVSSFLEIQAEEIKGQEEASKLPESFFVNEVSHD